MITFDAYRPVLFGDVALGAAAGLVLAWLFGRRLGGASSGWLVTWSGLGAAVGALVFCPAYFMAARWSAIAEPPEPASLFTWNAIAIVVLTAVFCGFVARNRGRLRSRV